MSKQARASHPIYSLLPMEVEGFDSLAGLALDLGWSWEHATDEVWRQHGSRYRPEPGAETNTTQCSAFRNCGRCCCSHASRHRAVSEGRC